MFFCLANNQNKYPLSYRQLTPVECLESNSGFPSDPDGDFLYFTSTLNYLDDAFTEIKKNASPSDIQIGGGHYKDMPIQPMHFFMANNVSKVEGDIIQYVLRYKEKGGITDLQKARHLCDMLIEHLTKQENDSD